MLRAALEGQRTAAIGALVAVLVVVPACSSDSDQATPAGYPVARLQRLAMDEARANGDRHPVSIRVVRTRFLRANGLLYPGDKLSADVEPDTPVFVVQVRGDFTCNTCHHRFSGSTTPITGTVMTTVLDAATLRSRSFGMGNHPTDLSSVGKVVTIKVD